MVSLADVLSGSGTGFWNLIQSYTWLIFCVRSSSAPRTPCFYYRRCLLVIFAGRGVVVSVFWYVNSKLGEKTFRPHVMFTSAARVQIVANLVKYGSNKKIVGFDRLYPVRRNSKFPHHRRSEPLFQPSKQ